MLLFSYLKKCEEKNKLCRIRLNKKLNKEHRCLFAETTEGAKRKHISSSTLRSGILALKAAFRITLPFVSTVPGERSKQEIHFQHRVILLSFVCLRLRGGDKSPTSTFKQDPSARSSFHRFVPMTRNSESFFLLSICSVAPQHRGNRRQDAEKL